MIQWLLCLVLISVSAVAHAAQQFQGLCALVKMEIPQELTLERVGFLATLEVTNNESVANITDFSAAITFESIPDDGSEPQDVSELFFVKPPVVRGVSSIDGAGIIQPGETAIIEWFIIPKIDAGGTTPDGIRYNVGAQLAGSIFGQEIAPAVLTVIPDDILVRPEPQLSITYFQPRDVDGDDPFTPDISEAPIPFPVGVLVENKGFGRANQVRVASEQPKIVENEQALVLTAQLLGSRVDDEPTDQTSLTLNLGDIEPGSCRKGAWDMVTSLSGTFIEFNASYTHASDLGGRDTSIIKDVNAHFILREVINDQPGRDGLKDFLADTLSKDLLEPGVRLVPDTLFESDCNTLPVNTLDVDPGGISFDGVGTTTITVNAAKENWVFLQIDDPAQAKLPIERVVRSDGKVLNPHNTWTAVRYRFEDNEKLTFLNIFDFVDLGTYTYTVTYGAPPLDVTPPVTTLRFQGDVEAINGDFYLAPETRVFFTAEDDSPTGIFYRFVGDGDFLPFVPFTLPGAGDFEVEFFSRDNQGNEEPVQTARLILSPGFPDLNDLSVDNTAFVTPGETLSVRATEAVVRFNGGSPNITINGLLEVFRGAYAFPTLGGIPASPTISDSALITVAGTNVDFYRFSVNGGALSPERPADQAIALDGLIGEVELRVWARAARGNYDDERTVMASWRVDPAADPIQLAGPATPTRELNAQFIVMAAPSYCYRIDGGAYFPDDGGPVIVLEDLEEGVHILEVLPRTDAFDPCPGDEAGTAATWLVDRAYGTELPQSQRILTEQYPDIGGQEVAFVWDGADEAGAVVPPDVYSVKVTISDSLGRETSEVRLVEVGDLIPAGAEVAGVVGANQVAANAAGRWAVWQDQKNARWDVFAQDLADPAGSPIAVSPTVFNQERPQTDGVYVVWEDRQADGSWDVWLWELGSAEPAVPITQTPSLDERSPSIDWPWVAFERRPVGSPNAPWQIAYVNLSSGATGIVDPTSADQRAPDVDGQRVVWEDRRDLGPGEIYAADLQTLAVKRITNDPAGQIQPTIDGDWIVWADNRQGLQLDLYGFNFKRGVELQLTDTPQDEAWPSLSGKWVVYTDDSAIEDQANLKLLSLSNLASIQLTNFESVKEDPSIASGKLVWIDRRSGDGRVLITDLPDLQPVFDNNNAVVVTPTMVSRQVDAFSLLELWSRQAGVARITRYTGLVPAPISQTAEWDNGPSGDNFMLEAGTFLWVEFDATRVLDLGQTACGPVDLPAGISAIALTCFPDDFSAYRAIRNLGAENVNAVRLLNADSGKWSAAVVSPSEVLMGEDFPIPRVGVLLVDLKAPVDQWDPGR